jgi:hypothetical protein
MQSGYAGSARCWAPRCARRSRRCFRNLFQAMAGLATYDLIASDSNRMSAELSLRQLRAHGGYQQAGDGNATCVRADISLIPLHEGAHVQSRIQLCSG